jgi:hypothetical protein
MSTNNNDFQVSLDSFGNIKYQYPTIIKNTLTKKQIEHIKNKTEQNRRG